MKEAAKDQRRVKLFWRNGSQAVRLPKEFQFATDTAFIRREGENVILSPHPKARAKGLKWYLKHGRRASEDFLENIDDPPPEDRESWRDGS